MRIAISGAHGVGKTTLSKALAKTLNLPRIQEVARTKAKEMHLNTTEEILNADDKTKMEFQRQVFYEQVMAEMTYAVERKSFISDRSVFDAIAYMQLYNLPPEFIDGFINYAARYSVTYDLIVYCPIPAKGIIDDGFRLTDQKSQATIDIYIKYLLLSYAECSILELSSVRDTWHDTVIQHIRKAGARHE